MRKMRGLLIACGMWLLVCGVLFPSCLGAEEGDGRTKPARYTDPKGYFTIVPPAGWKIEEYPQDPRGKVTFIGPEPGVDLRVLVNMVDFEGIDDLLGFCENAEARIGVDTHIRKVLACGRPAVRREFVYKGVKVYVTDLIVGRADHNLQYGALPEKYEKYLPVIKESIETYEPVYREVAGEELTSHLVAKKLRLARAMRASGRLYLALEEIDGGLDAAPNDTALLQLKKEIEGQIKR